MGKFIAHLKRQCIPFLRCIQRHSRYPVFDHIVALVYYPGSGYFHDLVYSTWYQGIIGDKQLTDSQAYITVPITDQL